MLFSYGECEAKYGTNYKIQKAINEGVLYKIASGIYSDTKNVSEIEIIAFKYPNGVLH